MNPAPSNGIIFLGVYVLMGILGSLYVLGKQTHNMEKKRLAWTAVEIGAVGGVLWWLLVGWLGLISGSGIFAIPISLAMRVIPWGIVVGLFAAWRSEKAGVPSYQTSEIATWICGTTVLPFLVISALDLVVTSW